MNNELNPLNIPHQIFIGNNPFSMYFLSIKDSFLKIISGCGGSNVQYLRDFGDGVEGYILNLVRHRLDVP